MNTPVHDRNLINRNPIDQTAWARAWRTATNNGADDHPTNRPGAQVGTCPRRGCRGALVPTNPPELIPDPELVPHARDRQRCYEAICTACSISVGRVEPTTPAIGYGAAR